MRLGQWVSLLALAVSLYILWKIRQVLLLAFMAVVLATALNQLVKWLEQLGAKRGIAIALSVITVLTLLAIFIAVIVPPFFEQLPQLIEQVPRGLDRLRVWFEWLQTRIPGQSPEDSRVMKKSEVRSQKSEVIPCLKAWAWNKELLFLAASRIETILYF